MSQARNLLDDLAIIGATIEPAGTQLILRAGARAIPATLVRQVREAKSDLIAMLSVRSCAIEESEHVAGTGIENRTRSKETQVIEWLNQHPSPSQAGACAWCRRGGRRTRWSCHSEPSRAPTHGSMPNAGALGIKHVEPKRCVRCRPVGISDDADIGTVPHDVIC
jgi:hypothetical protein